MLASASASDTRANMPGRLSRKTASCFVICMPDFTPSFDTRKRETAWATNQSAGARTTVRLKSAATSELAYGWTQILGRALIRASLRTEVRAPARQLLRALGVRVQNLPLVADQDTGLCRGAERDSQIIAH